jgi:hypothetical protein
MGKVFHASDSDKTTAGRKANSLARRYKNGVCWTPSREKDCVFDSNTGLWTCRASAHHHYGSCGTWEIVHGGRGTEWQLGWTWEHDWGGNLKSAMSGAKPSDLGSFEDYTPDKEDFEEATQEDYNYMADEKETE